MASLGLAAPRRHGSGLWATSSPTGPRGRRMVRHIVYVRKSSLYTCNADGSDSRELLSVPGVPFAPRFSPDGHRLRFTIRDTNQRTSSLWEVSADGKGLHPVLPDWNKPAEEFGGAWTPDGKYFLFEATRDHTQNIWARREATSFFRKSCRRADPTDRRATPVQ